MSSERYSTKTALTLAVLITGFVGETIYANSDPVTPENAKAILDVLVSKPDQAILLELLKKQEEVGLSQAEFRTLETLLEQLKEQVMARENPWA